MCFIIISIVDFPTVIQNISLSAIGNIFVDYSRNEKYYILPLFSGLSDHDAQLVLIRNIDMSILPNTVQSYRKIDKLSIVEFKQNLRVETWDNMF